jgi:hypothetical protein
LHYRLADMKVQSTTLFALCGTLPFVAARLERRVPSGTKTVIAQMFQWNWDSIATECTNFLGPAGYGYIQGCCFSIQFVVTIDRAIPVSPAQEHPQGAEWSSDYEV